MSPLLSRLCCHEKGAATPRNSCTFSRLPFALQGEAKAHDVSGRAATKRRCGLVELVLFRRLGRPPPPARTDFKARASPRADGFLSYRLKKPARHGNTTLLLTPLELLMRLASLIPGPGHPTRKYFGLLAPAAKERALVVPAPTKRRGSACEHHHDEPTPSDTAAPPPHAERLLWAELFRRTWGGDALECFRCKGRLRPIAVLHDPDEIARFLAHTGETTAYAGGPPRMAA